MSQTCIIVGASHAAAQLAPSLRQEGWDGRIVVIGDEPHLPYHRPPLSKAYLLGEKRREELLIRTSDAYARLGIEFRLGERVTSIDRASRSLALASGASLAWDKLALCTGTRVRTVDLPGVDLSGVYYLRSIADIDRIREDVRPGMRAVIVGGGYIGLETAAVLNQIGMQVSVLEMAPRVLARVTAPEVSAFFERVHREAGVDVCTGVSVAGFEGGARVERVIARDGRRWAADLVVIGVGVLPNVEIAARANLAVDDGIVVDACARTSDPDIVAVGDCTRHPSPWYGPVRLESVPNATEQAKSAAAALCGKDKPYAALPWFWSDQYDIKLQIAGLNQGYDSVVVRGERETGRSFAAFYLKAGRLVAADCVNRPQDFMASKRLIADGGSVQASQLVDEGIALKTLVAGADA
ncbi:FAD-dependent pyridine nucleotide-disulfide oxidoreductase [Burkholderia multivorans]|uniref:NAD(P)/FAD-dependent oxidoreductase n=1 Tax=Burkholderia multivorans TaxID=87883 RepID=UPI0019CEFA26|nr:FAD-dependent oxidoreductase [Burkholderia multivorans]CAB5301067.1 FAD-dependent pyridine nucleotide-disulfide oxidoreductase [Burkholderia multivorans]CAB5305476.1 FAD-dependent pyridine nucleotide-disulfide oxidoreductase [Burkholderia multivorans]CAB5310569.1 FAD-dependent pyridine nucleotide-disulfide oxidoreductase [Burkholderia multivorans]CAB5312581.1 FAD-dependent pyridine nucleotide-disulfide oxidoreductase [Burkholderia multivorans]CAB5312646.1 FAD-dependent pyridine nucleotide-d